MHQHALDTILQRHGAGIARPARTAELQQHGTLVREPAELDIAAVFLDSRPYPRLEQLLDHADDLAVVLVVRQAVGLLGGAIGRRTGTALLVRRDGDDGLARGDGLGDEGKDLGTDMRPVRVGGLVHGDEVGAVEDRGDAVNVHELGGQRGRVGRRDGGARVEVLDEGGGEGVGEDAVIREELYGVWVGRVFSLDEDCADGAGAGGEGGWSLEGLLSTCCCRATL